MHGAQQMHTVREHYFSLKLNIIKQVQVVLVTEQDFLARYYLGDNATVSVFML